MPQLCVFIFLFRARRAIGVFVYMTFVTLDGVFHCSNVLFGFEVRHK